jgi:hypothetical protein
MTTETIRYEPWPVWAKLILAALIALIALSILPWLLMGTGAMGMNIGMGMNMSQMSAACLQMMQAMGGGMMR